MERRDLGRTGLRIMPLVFGGNVFGWTIDEAQSFAVLDAFVDHGFDAIDTADCYSAWAPGNRGGESETIIGNWLKARPQLRDRMTIFTKVGSITGAPKIRAMQIIEELEPVRRSLYCGSLGYIGCEGQMDMNITIRTLIRQQERIHVWGGGGIVADSDADAEYQESLTKVQVLMQALENHDH